MNIAFCIYDGMTILDFIGAYDSITRLDRMDFMPLEWDVCAQTESVVTNDLDISVDRLEPDLSTYDLVFFPGGYAVQELLRKPSFIKWVQTANRDSYLTSVCTGTLLLGASGFLDGKRATTHRSAFDRLREYAEVMDERVVHDGTVITGRGVSSSIDLGLYIVEVLSDTETRKAVATQMDYPYYDSKSIRQIS